MAAPTKRYCWIKLKKDFFSGMYQRKMRKQPNGELLLIVYLKMMVATCDSEGRFYYQGVFDDIATEIAETIVEDPEDVRNALDYFENNGLVELSADECYTPEVMNCVGGETENAEKMRDLRKKRKESQSCNNVTECYNDVTESNARVTECDTEKEIDKRIDKDIELDKDKSHMFNTTSVSTVRRDDYYFNAPQYDDPPFK